MKGIKVFLTENKRGISLLLNLLVVALILIFLMPDIISDGISSFSHHHTWSCLMGLVSSVIYLIWGTANRNAAESPKWLRIIRYLAASALAMTFITSVTFISGAAGYVETMIMDKGIIFRTLIPLLTVVSFAFFEPYAEIGTSFAFLNIIPTGIYFGIMAYLNMAGSIDGPYYFLEYDNLPGIGRFSWALLMIGGAYEVGRFIIFLGKAGNGKA